MQYKSLFIVVFAAVAVSATSENATKSENSAEPTATKGSGSGGEKTTEPTATKGSGAEPTATKGSGGNGTKATGTGAGTGKGNGTATSRPPISTGGAASLLAQNGGIVTVAGLGVMFAVFM